MGVGVVGMSGLGVRVEASFFSFCAPGSTTVLVDNGRGEGMLFFWCVFVFFFFFSCFLSLVGWSCVLFVLGESGGGEDHFVRVGGESVTEGDVPLVGGRKKRGGAAPHGGHAGEAPGDRPAGVSRPGGEAAANGTPTEWEANG